jgi:deazaflavin-dependent oxidoreductase (nitroreductase family)
MDDVRDGQDAEGRSGGRAPTRLGRLSSAISNLFAERGIYLGKRSTKVHVALYRASRGRLGRRVPGWPGTEIALVDHRGARSGRRRTSPLMICRDGEAIAVVASKAGLPSNPAWYHNLLAHPDTRVQVGAKRRSVRARVAEGEERERLWARFVATFPEYEPYRERAAPRRIPVIVLEPR